MHLRKRTRLQISLALAILIVFTIYQLSTSTGFFQPSKIDSRDMAWERNGEFIKGSEPFTLVGKNETCWLLIHSYSATPAEMRELGDSIYTHFGDTVVGMRLEGHGELPSHLEDKNISTWYAQAESEFLEGKRQCTHVNVVGSSLGALIAARLAEEHDVKNVYLLNTFVTKPLIWYKPLPFAWRLKLLSPFLHYDKKTNIGNINDPLGKMSHIAYWNMPYAPIRNSIPFIKETKEDFKDIHQPLFIAHSSEDQVASISASLKLYDQASSVDKQLLILNRSNHILLLDYEKEKVINSILSFEEEHENEDL